jgi:hypothetical protein
MARSSHADLDDLLADLGNDENITTAPVWPNAEPRHALIGRRRVPARASSV